MPTPTPPPTPRPTIPPPDVLEGQLMEAGMLHVCLALVGPPAAEINDSGDAVGYNVDFGNELAGRLGLTADFDEALFADLPALISGHRCDVSISSQNITESRVAEMSLVPYTRSRQPVLVATGNPASIDMLADLCGLRVSTTLGSTHVDLVNGTADYAGDGLDAGCASASAEPIDLQTFGTEADAVQALLDDDVDAYLGNPNYVYDYVGLLEYSPAELPPAEQGIGSALDRPLIGVAIEAALNELIDDGTYLGILRRFLPDDQSVRDVSIAE